MKDAAKYPYDGINIKFVIILNARVSRENKITLFKYLSFENSTETAGACRNIKGIANDNILTAKMEAEYSGKSMLIISGRIKK